MKFFAVKEEDAQCPPPIHVTILQEMLLPAAAAAEAVGGTTIRTKRTTTTTTRSATSSSNVVVKKTNEDTKDDEVEEEEKLYEYAITSVLARSILKLANLDFVYIFEQDVNDEGLDEEKKNDTDSKEDGNWITWMRESLRQTLSYYPILAGRIHGTRVCLNNLGIAFRYQQVLGNRRIEEIPTVVTPGVPYCTIPIPKEQANGRAPIMTVTITQFQNGWTLGVVMNHLIVDGYSFAMFMKDWSTVYNGGKLPPVIYHLPPAAVQACQTKKEADQVAKSIDFKPSPYFNRSLDHIAAWYIIPSLFAKHDPREAAAARKAPVPPSLIIHYTKNQLQQLKDNALRDMRRTRIDGSHEEDGRASNGTSAVWISTNEALLAHVWKLMLDAAEIVPSQLRTPLLVGFVVNLRNRLEGVTDRVMGCASLTAGMMVNGKNPNVEEKELDEESPDGGGGGCHRSNTKDDVHDSLWELRVHNALRDTLRTEPLTALRRLQNYTWGEDRTAPIPNYEHKVFGDVHSVQRTLPGCFNYNNQAKFPFYQIQFGGIGCTLKRGIPWSWNLGVTVFPAIDNDGGVDVHINTMSDENAISVWKTPPPTIWTRIRTAMNVLGPAVGIGAWMIGPQWQGGGGDGGGRHGDCGNGGNDGTLRSDDPLPLLGWTSLGLLWCGIQYGLHRRIQRDVQQSKQAFHRYVQENSHRTLS